MSLTVWKFGPLYQPTVPSGQITTRPRFDMPVGARVLYVAMQDWLPYLWALLDPDAPTETRTFRIVGTGHEAPGNGYVGSFLDTFLVWHLFEEHQ